MPTSAAVAGAALTGGGLLLVATRRERGARAAGAADLAAARAEQNRLLEALQRLATGIDQSRAGIAQTLVQVRSGHIPDVMPRMAAPLPTGDLGRDLSAALTVAYEEARHAVVHAAQVQTRLLSGERELADIVRSIAPRLMTTVIETLAVIDTVEDAVEDPDLLHELFTIDHLVIQVRRAVESLAVLGGSTPSREAEPVLVPTVVRRAVQEIRDYTRVRLTQVQEHVSLPGYVTPALVHLLAELMENATRYSAPDTTVEVSTTHVSEGLAVDVEDWGLGISAPRLAALNALLAEPETVDTRQCLVEGQIGLLVAARLAARHRITIRLQSTTAGTRASVIVPAALLCAPDPEPRSAVRHSAPGTAGPRPTKPSPSPSGLPRSSGPGSSLPRQHPDHDAGDSRPPLPLRSRTPVTMPEAGADAVSAAPTGEPTAGLAARFLSRTPREPDPG
ncbi:ATP-binding protein [Streptomyces sp. NPDC004609]|uniref:sensor histidine kinase n=1 Tax=Streptomyces sp. NPDC004609 TaxID=3364704 RepID=UPI0036C57DF4